MRSPRPAYMSCQPARLLREQITSNAAEGTPLSKLKAKSVALMTYHDAGSVPQDPSTTLGPPYYYPSTHLVLP